MTKLPSLYQCVLIKTTVRFLILGFGKGTQSEADSICYLVSIRVQEFKKRGLLVCKRLNKAVLL